MKVSVVVPAFNEEGNILPTAQKIDACFQASTFQGELLFVDDGSTDGTYAEMQNAADQFVGIRLLHHHRQRGLTEALKTGFTHVTGDIVMFLPADLQYDPEEVIPKLFGKICEGYEVAAGYKDGEDQRWRGLLSKVSNFTMRRLFGVSARNMNAVRAFRTEVLEDMHLRSERHSLMLPLAAVKGYTIGETPVTLYPRAQGQSKFHLLSFILAFFDMISVKLLISFSQRPMLLFGLIGGAFLTIAFFVVVYLGYNVLQHSGTLLRPLFLIAGALASAGLLFLLIGFVAELIVEHQELARSQNAKIIRELKEQRKMLETLQSSLTPETNQHIDSSLLDIEWTEKHT